MIDSFNRAPGGDLFISEVFVAYPWWKRRSTTMVGLDIRHASGCKILQHEQSFAVTLSSDLEP
jgi:hypothetical protein